jgi:hypothetical protein
MSKIISRRHALLSGAALAILGPAAIRSSSGAAEPKYQITLYRDPDCACCMDWVAIAQKTFAVEVIHTHGMMDIKQKLDVPSDLMSCHTGVIDKYVIEGHVPIADIERLLRERPYLVRGLAVPGMPVGSPGMESPDGRVDPYSVIAFRSDGEIRAFSRHGGA